MSKLKVPVIDSNGTPISPPTTAVEVNGSNYPVKDGHVEVTVQADIDELKLRGFTEDHARHKTAEKPKHR